MIRSRFGGCDAFCAKQKVPNTTRPTVSMKILLAHPLLEHPIFTPPPKSDWCCTTLCEPNRRLSRSRSTRQSSMAHARLRIHNVHDAKGLPTRLWAAIPGGDNAGTQTHR